MYEDNRKDTGRTGESIALSFLQKQGYTVVEKNFRCKFGEMDIIAENDDQLVFIEVRSCRSLNSGLPQESLNYFKKKRLTQIALFYLTSHNLGNLSCRFDVVAVLFDAARRVSSIDLIKNAFEATF